MFGINFKYQSSTIDNIELYENNIFNLLLINIIILMLLFINIEL